MGQYVRRACVCVWSPFKIGYISTDSVNWLNEWMNGNEWTSERANERNETKRMSEWISKLFMYVHSVYSLYTTHIMHRFYEYRINCNHFYPIQLNCRYKYDMKWCKCVCMRLYETHMYTVYWLFHLYFFFFL